MRLVNDVNGAGGTNLTGMWGQTSERDPDRLEILFRLVPAITDPQDKIGVLVAERRPKKDSQVQDLYPRATQLGLNPQRQLKRSPQDADDIAGIGQAFNFFGTAAHQFRGVVVMADSLFNDLREALVPIANASGLPTIYQWKAFVEAGGLVSFGPNIKDAYAMAGQYATRILNGEKPENMQVSRPDPSTFEVWMKISTAELLNIAIPATVSAGGTVYRVNTIL